MDFEGSRILAIRVQQHKLEKFFVIISAKVLSMHIFTEFSDIFYLFVGSIDLAKRLILTHQMKSRLRPRKYWHLRTAEWFNIRDLLT